MLYSRAGRQPLLYAETFSPNTPEGTCSPCHVLGRITGIDASNPSAMLARLRSVYGGTDRWFRQALVGSRIDNCLLCRHNFRFQAARMAIDELTILNSPWVEHGLFSYSPWTDECSLRTQSRIERQPFRTSGQGSERTEK